MALTKGHIFTSGEVVTPTKLNDLVDDATIDADAVDTTQIKNGAVTSAKLGSDLVSTELGSISIDKLSDVDTSTATPTDGQQLTWENSSSKWKPATTAATVNITGQQGSATTTALSDSADTTVGTISMALPSGSWSWVKVSFFTRLDDEDSAQGSIEDFKIKLTSDTMSWVEVGNRGTFIMNNSDDSAWAMYTAEGVPTSHTTENPLAITVTAQKASGKEDDDTDARQLYAVGYYA